MKNIRFQIATIPDHEFNTDLLVLFFNQDFIKKCHKALDIFPGQVAEYLDRYFIYKDFKGEFKETTLLYPENGSQISRILLVGLGKESKLSNDKYREIGYVISGLQNKFSGKRIHIYLGNLNFSREELIRSLTEGIYFKNYCYDEYKSEKESTNRNYRYVFVCNKGEDIPRFRKALLETTATMDGVNIAKNLANQPSNNLTPTKLKDFVIQHFKKFKNIEVEYFDKTELSNKNFNALLAVSKGSIEEPYLIVIRFNPRKPMNKKLVIVGKGVTFDTGGISIKPTANMEEMKYDMAGAAATIGIMDAFARIEPKFEMIGLIPTVENMPGGSAIKPGDIVKAYNGKTIEIINTDAEGRLILADALSFAVEQYKPDVIVDFATLTGSCVVALGDKMAGLFTNSDELAEIFTEAGNLSGDRVWRMPISDLYSPEIKSEVADIKNIGGKWGGAITAAKFLENFIGKTHWAHIDIAGTAYNVKDIEYLSKGATGFGPRLMTAALKRLEKFL